MAANGNTFMTVVDIAKQREPGGKIAMVAEVLSQTNELVQDMTMVESNAPTTHTVTVRSSLPSVGFSRINEGVPRSKSTTEQAKDSMGILAAYSDVDTRQRIVAGGGFDKVRWNEDQAFIEAMSQAAAQNVIYGNESVNESAFTGLTPRFNSLAGKYGSQVIDAGGAGSDNTSIWVVDWNERYVFGIYPTASRAGLSVEDRGIVPVTDVAGNPYEVYRNAYQWSLGVSVKDYRHVCRIANVDVSDLKTAGEAADTSPRLITKLMQAFGRMQPRNGAQRRIYCNQTVWTALSIMASNKTNLALQMREWAGMGLIPDFWGAPIRRVDQIVENEARVI